MLNLRSMILTAWVGLTACMTLVAGTPQWECRCADQGRAPGCCCDPPRPRPAATPAKACCHAQPARGLQTPAPRNTCVRALVSPTSLTVERPLRLEAGGHEVQWLPGEAPALSPTRDGLRPAPEGIRHALAPPLDRVLIFEHFLL